MRSIPTIARPTWRSSGGAKAHHEGYTLEYRIHHPVTGELRWMREVAWVVRDDVLERTNFDSYILDITDQKKAEIALTESRERYRNADRGGSGGDH